MFLLYYVGSTCIELLSYIDDLKISHATATVVTSVLEDLCKKMW